MENQIVLKGNATKRICLFLAVISGNLFPVQHVTKSHKYEEEGIGKFLCFIKNISWEAHFGPPTSWILTAG